MTQRLGWALAAILLAGAARADTVLATPYFSAAGGAGHSRVCGVTNVGKKELHITVELLAFPSGALVSAADLVIAPGASDNDSDTAVGGPIYCRFTGKFSKKDVRAAGQRVESGITVLSVDAY